MKMKAVLLSVSVLLQTLLITRAYAQSLPVTGTVTSRVTGAPVAGATVLVKGTSTATTTDTQGKFTITLPQAGSVLVISHIGMPSREITVRDGNALSVQLEERTNSMDEVVVVGYSQTQRRGAVTNAISTVRAGDLDNMPVQRLEQSLQGRVSGVTITSSSGQPGAPSTVRIRGASSTGFSDPLYIVDGIPIGGGLEYLNQNDIESIDVLKDAASAAIYGTRAASGVILVTTKKGKTGKIAAHYNGYYGTQKAWRKLDLLDATQYAKLLNEAYAAAGQSPRFPNPDQYGKGTDWQNTVFDDAAPIMSHDLSLSGGSEKSTYYASFGFLDQKGIVAPDNSTFKRFTVRFNSTHKITNGITFGTNIGYTRISSVGVGTNGEWGTPLNRAINIDPITPLIVTDPALANAPPYSNLPVVRDANGNPYGISNIVTSEILNPVAALKVQQAKGGSDKIVANAFAEIEFIKGLKFRSTIATDLAFWYDESFSPVHYLNTTNQVTLNGYTRNSNRGIVWLWENQLSYQRTIGKHSVTGLVGTTGQKNDGKTQGGTLRGLPVNDIKDASLQFPVPQTNQYFWGGEYEEALSSIFGRVIYSYDDKYLLTGIVRRDGSSTFGPNNKYGVFPSISAGWVASKEEFFPVTEAVSFLKLRGSYGVVGNDRIGRFNYLSTVGGGRNYTTGLTPVLVNGVSPNRLSNPDLKWEQTSQLNIGLDAVLFTNFNLTLEVFNKKTSGMLLDIAVPSYIGNVGPIGNIADMENRGVELELGYRKRIGEVDFKISGNVSYLKNEVTYLGSEKLFLPGQRFGPQGVEITRSVVGEAVWSFYGFKTNGLFQTPEDVLNHKGKDGGILQPDAKPGDIRFVDYNNDGKLTNDDRTIIGDPTPNVSFGFNAEASWKGFDILVFGQGVAGNEVFQALRRFDLPTANYTTEALSRWTGPNTSNKFPRMVLNDPNQNFSRSSDFYLQKGDYFRIKVLQIGYSLPSQLIKKAGLTKLRLYLTGNNLLTFTKYNGYDPEIGGDSFGTDRGIYPQARALMAGINIGF
ncbi:TonB-dependent receptor [Paraflavitalea sp. CAU 1676]|uniref:SusC/RagA family TonB-linked outer membrane protein n=1 Tax=Paraflavitalea sp. CAU 1676 TaxID=3032598 RepID=UPI0023DBC2FA|nr:TonB-dependent receptor [Paraflavitalea sp. CAU 1676]MDF2188024.1 TonB-dependent receptor [Paraflavitalea sp. CAU 1676]